MRVFTSCEALVGSSGEDLGVSDWVHIDQKAIDQFAEASGDHQWIHTDPARAARGPFGRTIAHGFMSLALLPKFWGQVYRVEGARSVINYGLNRVRFPSPLLSGSRIRGSVQIGGADSIDESAVQLTLSTAIHSDSSDRPVCIAEGIVRYIF